MHRLRLLPLLLFLTVAMAACTSGESARPDPTSTPTPTAEPTPTPTEAPTDGGEDGGGDEIPRPPQGSITIGGVEYPLGIGGYCWGAPGGPPAVCVDPIGTITTFPYAQATSGATVTISGELANLDGLVFHHVQFGLAPAAPVAHEDDWEAWHPQFDGDATLTPEGLDVTLPDGFAPGRYLLELYIAEGTGGNNAIYGAIVEVQ